MDQSESAYRIRGATASYLRGKGVVLEEDIRSRVNKIWFRSQIPQYDIVMGSE